MTTSFAIIKEKELGNYFPCLAICALALMGVWEGREGVGGYVYICGVSLFFMFK